MDKLPPAVTAALLQLSAAYRHESNVRADAARRIAIARQDRRAAQDVAYAAVAALEGMDATLLDFDFADGSGGDAVVWDQAGLPLAA